METVELELALIDLILDALLELKDCDLIEAMGF
jgi:hypothetical protein